MNRRPPPNHRPGFTLIEAAISCVLVSLVFVAGMTAAGAAARDRRVQTDMRTGSQLAGLLLDEIAQQRYADPAPDTIAPAAGASTADRSNWTHMDDYNGLSESPRDRAGRPIPGSTGWRWSASVAYTTFPAFAASGSTPPSGGVVGGLLGAITGTATAVVGGVTGPTDTGLKKIVVTVTSPQGVATTLTTFRSSAGTVDRVSTGTGFMSGASLTITVGTDNKAVRVAAPLLNTPANP
ncbi:MAG TPA: hypothetical protein PKE29_14375 [Phycisphaerales bacterium]|nr:hypothetical protein [Phycisphaerales bacterium]